MIEQKNIESPFTELFALLKQRVLTVNGICELKMYESDMVVRMQSHIDNAIEMLMGGLQDLGILMGLAGYSDRKVAESLSRLGFLISLIGNIAEALNSLKLDLDYVSDI